MQGASILKGVERDVVDQVYVQSFALVNTTADQENFIGSSHKLGTGMKKKPKQNRKDCKYSK